ncbi:hypothetical protein D3C87_1639300 [compost metagenome]
MKRLPSSRSLCSWQAASGVWIPKCCIKRWEWRVSSAAINATSRRIFSARALMSSRLPMGVATT